ncbi:uncharacterized protein LACBIDRAFT_317427 [Laccaria bicolor S238N-H82]|uniref:Predicted protein n=1 Tax=Laccaria bicolor (strain S238N-H82 / ATCC MYA-4686) TaxID=486041 RepID=B0D553_LACBS|nr:uncharacterized protein LACBIDRAFT_317427 [Laccaria bicolor S238N-H82]EDR10679.1 predicted protein [Laccaria bicolor S238N-H82]|eukprot:XP_001879129.1 predicted protein [Laccaria bicolor S238N-H82]
MVLSQWHITADVGRHCAQNGLDVHLQSRPSPIPNGSTTTTVLASPSSSHSISSHISRLRDTDANFLPTRFAIFYSPLPMLAARLPYLNSSPNRQTFGYLEQCRACPNGRLADVHVEYLALSSARQDLAYPLPRPFPRTRSDAQ